ncbi:hypothetical protein CWE12_12445 [Aliidiomarina sedimenti]|uniref:Uncharacterized protein n=1 Tax=Aliidiomarina sedimenti TaxID=1933879 RepID=A0ABY0BUS6_9GAMM|nr:hypothetical protein [Aliidiomarina sedimenti]RUO28032.1 hypothetical protein CWE12_12445 [Aliidiomarina sedimenti]
MIHLARYDEQSVRLTRELGDKAEHRLDLYLFIPGELNVDSQLIPEQEFYLQGIYVRRTYSSSAQLSPLVQSRLISRSRGQQDRADPKYRLSVSLYAYQYTNALESAARALLANSEVKRDEIGELLELSATILRRLRRNVPKDESLSRYHVNIDNYLSWQTEQQFLLLAARMPFADDQQDLKDLLIKVARREHKHREEQEYNSKAVNDDSTRMSNKMRLLRRLIEYPVTFKRRTQELGVGEQRWLKAAVAAVVMTFVSFLLLESRLLVGDITAMFLVIAAFLYGVREFFRDDIRQKLWLWLRKGRPKWRHTYLDVNSEQTIGRSLEWIDYQSFDDLPEDIRIARQGNTPQRGESILHYRNDSKMLPTRFLSGYAQTRESIILDLDLIMRVMNPSTHIVFRLDNQEIIEDQVEKRYVLNLVARDVEGDGSVVIQRWRIVINHNRIVEVELSA